MVTLKDLPDFGLTIVVTIVLFGALAIGLGAFQNSNGVYDTGTTTNNSFSATQNAYSGFVAVADNIPILGVSEIRYANGSTLEAAAYTTNLAAGTVNITKATATYYADYTFPDGTAYDIAQDGLVSMDNVSNQFGTIGTVFGVVILIGLVAGVFVFNRRT